MDTNIIDAYVEFSTKSIQEYNQWLLEYLYANRKLQGVLKTITDKTIKEYVFEEIANSQKAKVIDIDRTIFLSQQTSVDDKYNTIKFLFTKNTENFDEIKQNEELSKLYTNLPSSILIAVELNKWANSIAKKFSFEESINRITREHKDVFDEKILKTLSMKMPFLKKEFSKRQKVIEKLSEHYKKSEIKFDVIKLENYIDTDNYFIIKPFYDLKRLKFVGKRKIETIIGEQPIARDIIFILLDQLNYETLNFSLLEKKAPSYLIEIPEGTFKTKINFKRIEKMYKNINFNRNLYFIFDYKDYKKSANLINELNKYASIVVTNLDKKYDLDVLKNIKFLLLNDKNLKDKGLKELVQQKNITVFYEQDEDEVPENKMFIKNSKISRTTKRIMYE